MLARMHMNASKHVRGRIEPLATRAHVRDVSLMHVHREISEIINRCTLAVDRIVVSSYIWDLERARV